METWKDPAIDFCLVAVDIAAEALMKARMLAITRARDLLFGKIVAFIHPYGGEQIGKVIDIADAPSGFKIRYLIKKQDGTYGGITRAAIYSEVLRIVGDAE